MVRTLEWSAISSSCSPHFVRILHCDLSVLGSPTWAGSELHWGTHAPSPQQGCDPWRGCCSMYVVAWKNSFFFMTKQYSLCGDTTFCLFIHQWLDIWNVSTFWIWWVKLLWTFTYYFLCGSSGVALKPWSIYQMLDVLTLDQEGTPDARNPAPLIWQMKQYQYQQNQWFWQPGPTESWDVPGKAPSLSRGCLIPASWWPSGESKCLCVTCWSVVSDSLWHHGL